VVADFTGVRAREVGPDRVEVTGGEGRPRTGTFKTSVGYFAGYVGEGEISYAGVRARERARLAGEVLRERLQDELADVRIEYIGVDSSHHSDFGHPHAPYEVRVRAAARTATRELAELVGNEVEALATNGPAGGGGFRKFVHERIGIVSTLLDRSRVRSGVTVLERDHETQAA
jgi:hypothetical protein